MNRLAYYCQLAQAGRRKEAAQAFLNEASEEIAQQLMDAALWKEADVLDFESGQKAVLIEGRWGKFWLASPFLTSQLDPPAPTLSPSGVVALARGLVDVLSN